MQSKLFFSHLNLLLLQRKRVRPKTAYSTDKKEPDQMGGEMSKNTSCTIHPEHKLTLMKPLDPFYCTACKENGFTTGYGCSQCVVRVHRECMSPSPESSMRLRWKKHSLKFYPDMNAENGKPRFCVVCSQPVKGCGYRSSLGKNIHQSGLTLPKSIMVNSVEHRLANKMMLDCNITSISVALLDNDIKFERPNTSDACTFCGACSEPLRGGAYSLAASGSPSFHPSCLHLKKCININDVKHNLVASCSSTCDWCEEKSISQDIVKIQSWWYVSECAKLHYHVGCVSRMMEESWKSGGLTYDEDADDCQMSMRVDKSCQRKGERRGFVRRTIGKFIFVAGFSAVTGDPTGISGAVLLNLGSRLSKRPRFFTKGH